MNKYELTVIFKPTLEEEAAKAEADKVSDLIQNLGGTVEKIDEWGKRKLAYEIAKFEDGIYYLYYFSAEKTAPKELESRLRIQENVIRYLIINPEE